MQPTSDLIIFGQAIVATFPTAKSWVEPRRFLKAGTDGAEFQDAQGGDCIGVSTKNARTHAELAVTAAVLGFARVDLGGQVREGDEVISDSKGRAIKDPQIPGTTVHVQGIARTGGVDGKSILLEIRKYKLAHRAAGAGGGW